MSTTRSKVISGGQTGVDRAALDAAIDLGIDCGGWCPTGRRAEDGTIPETYPLKETDSKRYEKRTKQNIVDADATLVLVRGPIEGGTALTVTLATQLSKPCLVVDVDEDSAAEQIDAWLLATRVEVLNVAGPREGKQPGIYNAARALLRRALVGWKTAESPTTSSGQPI